MKKGFHLKEGLKRGAWTSEEDLILSNYISVHGIGKWRSLPANAGLNRCGKSCRLRWLNYLRPDIKRGSITEDEEELIIRLHKLIGNRWSLIAGRLPGRTDNEIKNYWNTYLKKKVTGEISYQQSSSRVRTAFSEKQTKGKTEKVKNQISGSTMKGSPNNGSEIQTDIMFTSAGHYDDVWVTELMQGSTFPQLSTESSYTSRESLHNIYETEMSFSEDYLRELLSNGTIEDGICTYHDSNSLYSFGNEAKEL